jgi:hypothetical protein
MIRPTEDVLAEADSPSIVADAGCTAENRMVASSDKPTTTEVAREVFRRTMLFKLFLAAEKFMRASKMGIEP